MASQWNFDLHSSYFKCRGHLFMYLKTIFTSFPKLFVHVFCQLFHSFLFFCFFLVDQGLLTWGLIGEHRENDAGGACDLKLKKKVHFYFY